MNNIRCGYGVYTVYNRAGGITRMLEGEWKNGNLYKGEDWWNSSGVTIKGTFSNNGGVIADGVQRYRVEDSNKGSIYEGTVDSQSQPHGYGTLYSKESVTTGTFEHGKVKGEHITVNIAGRKLEEADYDNDGNEKKRRRLF